MNKILKGAGVLLIVLVTVLSTVVVTAQKAEENFSAAYVSADTIEEQNENTYHLNNRNMVNTLGPSLFLQTPRPLDSWTAHISDDDTPYICYDNFWDVNEQICDVHWWGVVGYWTGSEWIPCDCEEMLFRICFYTDEYGGPGELVLMIIPVHAIGTFYGYYDGWTAYEWSYENPCITLSKGWVSIQGFYHPDNCWFLWLGSPDGDGIFFQDGSGWVQDDLAFELTGACSPSVDIEKYIKNPDTGDWVDADTPSDAIDIKICTNTEFKIVIHNNGECPIEDIDIYDNMHDSLELIYADPDPNDFVYYPPYYNIYWYFPGPLNPCETIEIYITAHVVGPVCSLEYNHVEVEAKSIHGNRVYDEDYAYFHCYKKSRVINKPLLQFLQNHPYLFSLLQKLIQGFRL